MICPTNHQALKFPLVIVVLAMLFSQPANAEFILEDPALANCVNKQAEKRGWTNPQDVTEIKCHNKKVESANGLEQFVNLSSLSLFKNRIAMIDLSHFPRLEVLNVAGNQLLALAVTQKQELVTLYAFHNPLESLSVSDCPRLVTIKANNGRLTRFNLSGVGNLEKLYLFDNQLEMIDIPTDGALRYLDVRQNPMPDDFYDYLDSLSGLTSLHDGNAEDWD